MERLLLLAALALTACTPVKDAGEPRQPNVVVVLVDDLRWDDIGVAGHPFSETPNIDRLAREGARFLNAFATTPLCSPSRAAILTGLYAHANGIIDNLARDSASHRLPTFAIPLAAAGYQTAFIGKWHMGNDDTRRPGWTHWVAMKGQGEAINPNLNVDGERLVASGYVTDVLTDYAIAFIRAADDEPFLLFLAHKALHPNTMQRDDGKSQALDATQPSGFVPAERHRGRYADAVVPRRRNALQAPVGKPALARQIDTLPPLSPAVGTPEADVRARLEMLLGVDESLGRIVETLESLGELDNTVVVLTSDHGYFYGEHGLNAERRLAYEETARIPMIIRFPGVATARLHASRDGADDRPRLDDRGAGGRVGQRGAPGEVAPAAAGGERSGVADVGADRVLHRHRLSADADDGIPGGADRALQVHPLHLMPGMDELYDLETDPFEMQNLMGTDREAELLPMLRAELERLQRETGYRPGG